MIDEGWYNKLLLGIKPCCFMDLLLSKSSIFTTACISSSPYA